MSAPRPSLEQLVQGVTAGDRAVLSRSVTLAESRRSDDQELAQDLLFALARGRSPQQSYWSATCDREGVAIGP